MWWTRTCNIKATSFLLALLCDIHICNLCICWIWTGASTNKSHIKSSTKSFFMVLQPILTCIYILSISISHSFNWTHTDISRPSEKELLKVKGWYFAFSLLSWPSWPWQVAALHRRELKRWSVFRNFNPASWTVPGTESVQETVAGKSSSFFSL